MLRISKHRDTTVSDKEVELETGTRYRESGLVRRHFADSHLAEGGGTLVAHDGAGNVGQKRLMFEVLPDRCYIIYNSICGSG